MRIDFDGKLVDQKEIRAGFVGCGSHAFRNVYPTFQFAPVKLAATCDLDIAKARAFAAKFGAEEAYDDYRRMLREQKLDAVFVVVGYDKDGRPLYPDIAIDCLAAGCHVWIEKPPAASCAEIDRMRQAAQQAGRIVMVGMKKMFFPANQKAKELMGEADFGKPSLVLLQYPQAVPTADEFREYIGERKAVRSVVSFLDHLCHPVSLMLHLLGMPGTLYYERAASGAGLATFRFASGAVASLALTAGASRNGGAERTTVVSDRGRHIVVDNNVRVSYHRMPAVGYGTEPNFYKGTPEQATGAWEPEFSLGQLYNKGLFLLGYYDEVNEFARCILDGKEPQRGTIEQAWQATRIFEAFAGGPGKVIRLDATSVEGSGQ